MDQNENAYLENQAKRQKTREELVAIIRANKDRLLLSDEHIFELDSLILEF